LDYFIAMSTVREIEAAIEKSGPCRSVFRLYKDMPQLIGRRAERPRLQRWGWRYFFHDDSPEDSVYDNALRAATLYQSNFHFPIFKTSNGVPAWCSSARGRFAGGAHHDASAAANLPTWR